MNRLSIAVKCKDCNRRTRNISGYCQDHGRNSKRATETANRPGEGLLLLNVRLPEAQRLSDIDPQAMEFNMSLGVVLRSTRPNVVVHYEHNGVTINNAFQTETQGEPLFYGDTRTPMEDQDTKAVGNLMYARSGKNALVYPNPSIPLVEQQAMLESIVEGAFAGAENFRQIRAITNDLEVRSETYDDKAEVLAQLKLAGNDPTAIRYSSTAEGKLTVFVKSPNDPEVIERWKLERKAEALGDGSSEQPYGYRYSVVGEGELVSRRNRKKIADSIPAEQRADRSELIGSIIETMETIDKHAVTINGRVHLPLGWTD